MDLSFPRGTSVNDGISPEVCSLQYTSVERVDRVVQNMGTSALPAKLDVRAAYRLVPVHPVDRELLGIRWGDTCYVDGMLPFGIRSAPKIFTAVADTLEWCLRQRGVAGVDHYLNDYIVIGPPNSSECRESLTTILSVCESLGVPIATEKLEGPTSCLTFLGIEIDTVAEVLWLPEDKLSRLHDKLQKWSRRRACQRRQLESLIGLLQHACRVVRPGCSFLRQIIALLSHSYQPYHRIRLNRRFRADLLWWRTFLSSWSGIYVFPPSSILHVSFASDASGQWSCGVWCESRWFSTSGHLRHRFYTSPFWSS